MTRRTIRLEDYERRLAARLKARGYEGTDFVSPNSGVSRTEQKRDLLRALAELVRKNGREPKFKANF